MDAISHRGGVSYHLASWYGNTRCIGGKIPQGMGEEARSCLQGRRKASCGREVRWRGRSGASFGDGARWFCRGYAAKLRRKSRWRHRFRGFRGVCLLAPLAPISSVAEYCQGARFGFRRPCAHRSSCRTSGRLHQMPKDTPRFRRKSHILPKHTHRVHALTLPDSILFGSFDPTTDHPSIICPHLTLSVPNPTLPAPWRFRRQCLS